jgi:hypothetical protein
MSIFKFLSLPAAGKTYEIKFDYFISGDDNKAGDKIRVLLIKHSTSDGFDTSKRITPRV